jgi:hypothetical protein
MIEATIELFGGKSSIKVSAEDSKDLIQQMAFFTAIPSTCDICGASLHFSFRNPDPKVKYWGVVCEGNIPHTLNFGVHTDEGKGLFVKDEWEFYDTENQEYRKIKARDVKAKPPQEAKPANTLSPERASKMREQLNNIEVYGFEQIKLASDVVGRTVSDVGELTEEEAARVWKAAKNRQA